MSQYTHILIHRCLTNNKVKCEFIEKLILPDIEYYRRKYKHHDHWYRETLL